jgi:hypothetical protein
MEILHYTETTTGGSDPTQIETWRCASDRGHPFIVTQFFGNYHMIWGAQGGGSARPVPAWVVRRCEEHARQMAEAEECPGPPVGVAYKLAASECLAEEIRRAEGEAGWDSTP